MWLLTRPPRPRVLLPAFPALPVPRVFKDPDDGRLFGLTWL